MKDLKYFCLRRKTVKALAAVLTAASAFLMFSGFTSVPAPIAERLSPEVMGTPSMLPGEHEGALYLVSAVHSGKHGKSTDLYYYRSDGTPTYGELNDGECTQEYSCYKDGTFQGIYEHYETATVERTYHEDGTLEGEWITETDKYGKMVSSKMSSFDSSGNPTYFRHNKASSKNIYEEKYSNSYNDKNQLSRVRMKSKDILMEERSFSYEDDGSYTEEYVKYIGESYGNTASEKYTFQYNSEGLLESSLCTLLDEKPQDLKSEYVYDKNGYLIESREAVSKDGKTVEITETEYQYTFAKDGKPLKRTGTQTRWKEESGSKGEKKTDTLKDVIWEYDKHGNLIRYDDGTDSVEYEYAPLSKIGKSAYS